MSKPEIIHPYTLKATDRTVNSELNDRMSIQANKYPDIRLGMDILPVVFMFIQYMNDNRKQMNPFFIVSIIGSLINVFWCFTKRTRFWKAAAYLGWIRFIIYGLIILYFVYTDLINTYYPSCISTKFFADALLFDYAAVALISFIDFKLSFFIGLGYLNFITAILEKSLVTCLENRKELTNELYNSSLFVMGFVTIGAVIISVGNYMQQKNIIELIIEKR